MKILIVSFFDDNFGDMLIRICFENLLRCALENLGVKEDEIQIEKMNQMEIDSDKIFSSDVVFFSGGAMFGFNYQNFLENIEKIVSLAQSRNIPVVFSSLGVNHIESCQGDETRLCALLENKTVKYMSVREHPELFEKYAKNSHLDVIGVCDPAVWAGTVYSKYIEKKESKKTVGINVVRGGLFKANGINWSLEKEEKYLSDLKNLLEKEGIDYRFFTNGSVLDCNTMKHFSVEYGIPEEKMIYPDTSLELIRAVSSFDAVACVRLHASIVSYSLAVPSVNLVWNEKVPYFYKNIGYPERALPIEGDVALNVFNEVTKLLHDSRYKPDEKYLMTLFDFLIDSLSGIFSLPCEKRYSFEQVSSYLKKHGVDESEEMIDISTKLKRGAHFYFNLFNADREKHKKIKELEAENKRIREEYISSFGDSDGSGSLAGEIEKLHKKLYKAQNELENYKNNYEKERRRADKYKARLDKINSRFIVRLYNKIKKLFGKK